MLPQTNRETDMRTSPALHPTLFDINKAVAVLMLATALGMLLWPSVSAAQELAITPPTDLPPPGSNDHRLPYHLDSLVALMMLAAAVGMAAMLNASAAKTRTIGTLCAALVCFTVVGWFLVVAASDAFSEPKAPLLPTDPIKPALLWILTLICLCGGVLLLRAAARQRRRNDTLVLPDRNDSGRFGRISRLLHWTTAILFLSLIPMGIFMTMIQDDVWYRQGYYVVHKTIGFLVFALLIARLVWHRVSPQPPLETSLSRWEKRLAKIVHVSLYVIMFAMPITGFALSTYGGMLSHFFIWDFPLFWGVNLEAGLPYVLLHKVVIPLLIFLVFAGHLLGVLKHHFIDKHGESLRRMVS